MYSFLFKDLNDISCLLQLASLFLDMLRGLLPFFDLIRRERVDLVVEKHLILFESVFELALGLLLYGQRLLDQIHLPLRENDFFYLAAFLQVGHFVQRSLVEV